MAIIVDGVTVRTQTATKEFKCDGCPKVILPGSTYKRVRREEEGKDPYIEMYHPPCFKDQFTDEVPAGDPHWRNIVEE